MNKMKMSKSLGNVVDPFALIDQVGINSVRSYFLSEGPLTKDSNFELEGLIEHHNKVICDSYVNMLFRITGKKILKDKSCIPPPKHLDQQLINGINKLSKEILGLYSAYDFIEAFKKIQEVLYLGNSFLSERHFWAITDEEELNSVLFTTFEVIRVSSILLQPYCPDIASKILDFVGVKDRLLKDAVITDSTLS